MKTLRLRSFFLFLMILPSFSLFSQDNYEDVVYLKDGSVIHGMIIEQVPGVSIKIQTYDRNVFFYKLEEIEKITKELKPSDVKHKKPKKQYPKKGLIVQANLITAGASAEASYLIFPVSIGIGAGYNIMMTDFDSPLIPIFLDCKVYFTKTKWSPFLAFEGGYTFNTGSDENGSPHINPYVGIKLMLSDNLALSLSVGVNIEKHYDYSSQIYALYYEPQPDIKLGVSYRFGK